MQKYQVFINEHSISFQSISKNVEIVDNFFGCVYPNEHEIEVLLDYLVCEEKPRRIYLFDNEPELLWQKFKSQFKIIEAAGGVVKNEKHQFLVIHRLGKWDLPKGKIELGERAPIAAVREVKEECGLQDVEISRPLTTSYHMYKIDNDWILKPTFWFEMFSSDHSSLHPQVEEDIDQVLWCDRQDFLLKMEITYASLREVLKQYKEI